MNRPLIGLDEMIQEAHTFKLAMYTYNAEVTRMKEVYSNQIPQSAINRAIDTAINMQKPTKEQKWILDGIFDTYLGAYMTGGQATADQFVETFYKQAGLDQ